MGNNINKKIDIALNYGFKLVGTPYGFSKELSNSPCYAGNKSTP